MKSFSSKLLLFGLLVTAFFAIYIVYSDNSLNSFGHTGESVDDNAATDAEFQASETAQQAFQRNTNPSKQKRSYTLEELYQISLEYNTCRSEIFELESRQIQIPAEVDHLVNQENSLQGKKSALLFAHDVGLINAQKAIIEFEDLEVRSQLEKMALVEFEDTDSLDNLSGKQAEIVDVFQAMITAIDSEDIELGIALEHVAEFKQLTGDGLFIKDSRNGVFVNAERMYSVLWLQETPEALFRYLSENGLSSQMLASGFSDGASPHIIRDAIDNFGFTNHAFIDVNLQLTTPLAVAVRNNQNDLIELAISKIPTSRETFNQLKEGTPVSDMQMLVSSPVNAIFQSTYDFMPTEPIFSERVSDRLALLGEAGFPLLVTKNKNNLGEQQLQGLGNEDLVISESVLAAFEAIGVEVIEVHTIKSAQIDELATASRSMLSALGIEYSTLSDAIEDKKQTCLPLETEWLESEPPLEFVKDSSSFRQEGLSFTQQLEHLSEISPTLADLYYRESRQRDARAKDGNVLIMIDAINYLSDVDDLFIEQFTAQDPDMFFKNELLQHLCDLGGIDGIKLAVEINRYFDMYNDYNECVRMSDDWQVLTQEIAPSFYERYDISPGLIYSQTIRGAVDEILMHIESNEFVPAIDLQGLPFGRDALMVALERFSSFQFRVKPMISDQDAYRILLAMLESTQLNDEHYRRLHRLKVANIVMFERLSERVPSILEAKNYEFNEFKISGM